MGHHHVTLDFETQEFADDFADSVRRSGEVIVEAGDNGIEESCAAEVVPEAEEDLPLLGTLYQSACMAADLEALKPGPASAILNPDGAQQRETAAELIRRIVGAALDCAIQNGLLTVPGDLEARMDAGISIR